LLGPQGGSTGQRHGQTKKLMSHPEAHQRRAHRRPRLAALDPVPKTCGSRQQRRQLSGMGGQNRFGALDFAFLVKIGIAKPLVQGEGGAGGIEDLAAFDDAQIRVHLQAQALDGGGEVPGVDQRAIGCGLLPHRLEPGPVQKRLAQRMVCASLVEPGDGGGRGGQSRGEGGGAVFCAAEAPDAVQRAGISVHGWGLPEARAGGRANFMRTGVMIG
jgi:hypothetical protein